MHRDMHPTQRSTTQHSEPSGFAHAIEEQEKQRRADDLEAAKARGYRPLAPTTEQRRHRAHAAAGRAIEGMPALLAPIGLFFAYSGFSDIDRSGVYASTLRGIGVLVLGGVLLMTALLVYRRTRPRLAIAFLLVAVGLIAAGLFTFRAPQPVVLVGLIIAGLLLGSANAIGLAPERFHGGAYDH